MADLELSDLRWIDKMADQYELEWQKGKQPRIDDYVEGVTGKRREGLLKSLFQLDVEYSEEMDVTVDLDRHSGLTLELIEKRNDKNNADTSERRAILRVSGGPHCGRTFTFTDEKPIIIGGGRGAQFRLAELDRGIADRHIELCLNLAGCQLKCLDGKKPTCVNDQEVALGTVQIQSGTRVKIGSTVIEVAF